MQDMRLEMDEFSHYWLLMTLSSLQGFAATKIFKMGHSIFRSILDTFFAVC